MTAREAGHPPSCNTGGTSISPPTPKAAEGGQKVIVDTVAFTSQASLEDIAKDVLEAFPGATYGDETHGRQGFKAERQILWGNMVLGWIDWGAAHGWTWVYIGGAGLRFRRARDLTDEGLPKSFEALAPRWSRVDLALDVFSKEIYSVDQAQADLAEGLFTLAKSAKAPWSKLIQSGSADDDRLARTQYVGKPASGKQIRIYDKGMQILGSMTLEDVAKARAAGLVPCEETPEDADLRDWVRLEVQYNKGDRILTDDMMVDRDKYFAGAYPACAIVLGRSDGIRPAYVPDDEDVELAWLVACGKQSYGGVVHHLRNAEKWTDKRIVDALVAEKPAKRISTIRERADFVVNPKTGWAEYATGD